MEQIACCDLSNIIGELVRPEDATLVGPSGLSGKRHRMAHGGHCGGATAVLLQDRHKQDGASIPADVLRGAAISVVELRRHRALKLCRLFRGQRLRRAQGLMQMGQLIHGQWNAVRRQRA